MNTLDYAPLHGLPPLAGLGTFPDAQRPGLSVEECVRRLKRYHFAFKRLHEIFVARLPAEAIYELKMAFATHAYFCAEHVASLRQRVGEMREPPLGLEAVPDENLGIFFDEIQAAPETPDLIAGIYEQAVPALIAGLERHLAETNPLADAPSVRLCKFALLELREMREYGAKAVSALRAANVERQTSNVKHRTEADERENGERGAARNVQRSTFNVQRSTFVATERNRAGASQLSTLNAQLLRDCLAAAGGLDGASAKVEKTITRQLSATPFNYDKTPRRDARFPDPYNMGVNAEAFLYDPAMPPEPKVLMMFYKRLREIDVPEMMASIITETRGKPWGYYRDMTRQLWDEARHAMLGEVGFLNLGVDWTKVMVNFTWSLGLNTQLTAKERHGVLYFIEQGLMPKTGKRFEWETAREAHNALSTLFQDYDWADEVLHARIGRDWYVSQFESAKDAVEWGDRAWSKVLIGWRQWRDEGLTEHRNWWPDVYLDYCRAQGIEPDEKVLAYDTTYETVRADLKVLTASA